MVKEPVMRAIAELAERAGEKGIISKSSALKIFHQEGVALLKAMEKRATEVFEQMPEAKILITGSSKKKYPKKKTYLTYDYGYDGEDEIIRVGTELWSYETERGWTLTQEELAAGNWLVVELDEIRVAAQPTTGREEWWVYTAVVSVDGQSYYLSDGGG